MIYGGQYYQSKIKIAQRKPKLGIIINHNQLSGPTSKPEILYKISARGNSKKP